MVRANVQIILILRQHDVGSTLHSYVLLYESCIMLRGNHVLILRARVCISFILLYLYGVVHTEPSERMLPLDSPLPSLSNLAAIIDDPIRLRV